MPLVFSCGQGRAFREREVKEASVAGKGDGFGRAGMKFFL